MTDFEYVLFDGLKKRMAGVVECGSVDSGSPPSMPFLAFEQLSNPVADKYLDSGKLPKYYKPQFRITVYTADNDKVTAKDLLEKADDFMVELGIIRSFGPQKVTCQDRNVCKMLSLYEGNLISQDGKIYTI